MLSLDHLKRIVEQKSNAPPVACDNATLRQRLGLDAIAPKYALYGLPPLRRLFDEQIESFLAHPLIGDYLRQLTPCRAYLASGVRILPLEAIKQQMYQLPPGVRIFWDGFLVFATSFHDNVLCFHAPSGRVAWAYQDSFLENAISYQEGSTGRWRYVPFSPENVERALVGLSDNLESFLQELLGDRLQARFYDLD
jgi:hypothetical protein